MCITSDDVYIIQLYTYCRGLYALIHESLLEQVAIRDGSKYRSERIYTVFNVNEHMYCLRKIVIVKAVIGMVMRLMRMMVVKI